MSSWSDWFNLQMPPDRARAMTREQYYATCSYLRRVRHIISLRYSGAKIVGNTIILPATDTVLPPKFQ